MNVLDTFLDFLPLLLAMVVTVVVLSGANWVLLRRRAQLGGEGRVPAQITML